MLFHLTDEQEMIRETIGRALGEAVEGRHASFADADSDFDRPLWQCLCEMGVPGLMVVEAEGGAGLGLLEAALVAEMVGYYAAPGPFAAHMAATAAVAASPDSSLRDAWLPGLLSGETIGAVAVGEGWLPDRWGATFAEGSVTGRFPLVPGGQHAGLLVLGVAGGKLVLVDPSDTAVTIIAVDSADPTRRVADVTIDGAPAVLLGERELADRILASMLVLLAADALGGAQSCLDRSVAYAGERRQFGIPIGQFQAIKHQLADLALGIEPARALMWYAAHAVDTGAADRDVVASHAKAHIADRFTETARRAIQVHGGIGYTWELGLHLWLRRALFDHAYLGPPALHRERGLVLAGV